MKIKIKFFEDELVNAIGTGIYEIYVQANNREELFYVGESVFVLVRCATHLYEIAKGNGYLGFTKETIENDNITIIFKLSDSVSDEDSVSDKKERRKKENEIIQTKNPKMQSGISDRVKSIENMIIEMTNFLNE